ncbi:MAG TPA: universal stress protein, partial [Pyrinomonadaceae bacterium]|nr:universal stress protein [Pyrinomonadaceae bacterium]
MMKVIIGYDGSPSADAAFEELKRAGLPADTEILVATVASIWMPMTDIGRLPGAEAVASRRVAATVAQLQNQNERTLKEAEEMMGEAAARIKSDFPDWQVETAILSGDTASEIIRKADEWQADLIVVGSQNRLAIGRFFLGSVSQKIFIEANCSVRIARGGDAKIDKNAPRRIVAGIDGADTGDLIIEAIAKREWAKESVLTLVTATDTFNENAVQPFGQIITAQEFQKAAREKLSASGLKVLTVVKEGDPRNKLLIEAEKLSADCILV